MLRPAPRPSATLPRAVVLAALTALLVLGTGAATGTVLTAAAAPRQEPRPAVARYIVRTASEAATTSAANGVRREGGQVQQVFSDVLDGFAATMTPEQADTIEGDEHVRSVTPDVRMRSTERPGGSTAHTGPTLQNNATWGLDRIDQRGRSGNTTYHYNSTGAGVTAFVLDSGIRTTHRQLGGRARSGHDFVDDDATASDCNGHGTHVAGTIGSSSYGVAKSVRLVAVRVLDCDGSGWASDIIDGLDWVVSHRPAGPSVVNLSVGGDAYPLLDQAVERTVAAGITVVVAAGNDDASACQQSPARAPHAITVAATDARDARASWSNYGSCVDLFAPGVDVRSLSNASDEGTAVMSGTSMATPHVTGAVARYLQLHPRSTPAQTTAALTGAATTGAVSKAAGTRNRLLYVSHPATAPAVLRQVAARQLSGTRKVSVSWRAPRDDGGRKITRYQVLVTDLGRGVTRVDATLSARSRSHVVARLSPGRSYRVSVRAVNTLGAGVARSATVAALT